VVAGHSHRPAQELRAGVLLFSRAAPVRAASASRSAGRLQFCAGGRLRGERVMLLDRDGHPATTR
jgi:hypothetical protein